jgi:hypothetical protein
MCQFPSEKQVTRIHFSNQKFEAFQSIHFSDCFLVTLSICKTKVLSTCFCFILLTAMQFIERTVPPTSKHCKRTVHQGGMLSMQKLCFFQNFNSTFLNVKKNSIFNWNSRVEENHCFFQKNTVFIDNIPPRGEFHKAVYALCLKFTLRPSFFPN